MPELTKCASCDKAIAEIGGVEILGHVRITALDGHTGLSDLLAEQTYSLCPGCAAKLLVFDLEKLTKFMEVARIARVQRIEALKKQSRTNRSTEKGFA